MSDLSRLVAEVSADREAGTEDAWWRSRIEDFALDEEYGREEVNGGQDAADRRRILRVPRIERALADAISQRDDFAQERERHAALFVEAMRRLTEARAAWDAFKGATVSDDHFAAVDRLDKALGVE